MGTAVDDVHHRRRQHARADAAQVAVERQAGAVGRGARGGEAHGQDGVGAQALLVLGAVELDHRAVSTAAWSSASKPPIGVGDLAVDGLDRLA